MYHYVYRITNTVLNKHYYGSRTSKSHPKDDLFKEYFTSSKEVRKDIDYYGTHVWKTKIIAICKTRQDAYCLEEKIQKKLQVVSNERFYNKMIQTSEKFSFLGGVHSLETKEKMSLNRKGIVPWNKNISTKDLGYDTSKFANSGNTNPMFGRPWWNESTSEEKILLWKQRISESTKGEKNPFYGKKHDKIARQKISDSRKNYVGEKHPMYGKKRNDLFWVNNGTINKRVKLEQMYVLIDDGWKRGKLNVKDKG